LVIYVFRGNPFQATAQEQCYHTTQPFKQEKYNTKSEICVKMIQNYFNFYTSKFEKDKEGANKQITELNC
jgi:thiamine pyrophosphokinase